MKWKKCLKRMLLLVTFLLVGCLVPGGVAKAETIYNSPYVKFAPDGQAWTTCSGEKHNYYYEAGHTVDTGVESLLRGLNTGEHYYNYTRLGNIPVGEWMVRFANSKCVHNGMNVARNYHDLVFGKEICETEYTQGWYAYCADCEGQIAHILMYMCEDAAKSIDYIPTGLDYYYLCPHCSHLEQGASVISHICKKISMNQYKIIYEPNTEEEYSFAMSTESYHMYNNATEYEGASVTPVKMLAKMNIKVSGYEFVGWNTKADGSGVWYEDEQEIYNLTEYDWKQDERGTITLYAQWKLSKSTLEVDPAGGSYLGNGGITSYTKYMYEMQELYPEELEAPDGATLSFQVNGGEAIAPVTAYLEFDHWETSVPFGGQLIGNQYEFLGKDGSVDRVSAVYIPKSIVLPGARKENVTFGGWYYNEECTLPAGKTGDSITIREDTVLYAKWVELILDSVENYASNQGKGAVDLSWSQKDLVQKTYRVYRYAAQGEEDVPGKIVDDWTLINASRDGGELLKVAERYAFSGREDTYLVPHTGLYTLTAAGASGGDYGDFQGGAGGEVTGSFWLNVGDVITYTIGGQNGYNGGGEATLYGNGGGATVISSVEWGTLLVAAGGGGASSIGDGGIGGGTGGANLLPDGYSGENGPSGGGGGYQGGMAGSFHEHTEDCYTDITRTAGLAWYNSVKLERSGMYEVAGINACTTTVTSASCYLHTGGTVDEDAVMRVCLGDASNYFATDGEGIFSFDIYNLVWGGTQAPYGDKMIRVYADDGTLLLSKNLNDFKNLSTISTEEIRPDWWYSCSCDECTYGGGVNEYRVTISDERFSGSAVFNYHATHENEGVYYGMDAEWESYITVNIPITEEIKGVYVVAEAFFPVEGAPNENVQIDLKNFSYTYSVLGCGLEEVASPAYGGSSYINTENCNGYRYNHGSNEGDGYFLLESENIGFTNLLEMEGVEAPDLEAPEAIAEAGVTRTPIAGSGGSKIQVSWECPEDRGSIYYFMVESHKALTGEKLSSSNVRMHTLTTGVQGYYYILNEEASHTVTVAKGIYQSAAYLQVTLADAVQYLHVAPVDGAGNLGETLTIQVENLSGEGSDPDIVIPWPVHTEQMYLTQGDGVCEAQESNTYYVRCDNVTPLELKFGSFVEGSATEQYQITHASFLSRQDGGFGGENIVITPMHDISDGEITTAGSGLVMITKGTPILKPYLYTATTRSNRNQELSVVSRFLLGEEADGKRIRVTPRAAVETDSCSVWSDEEADLLRSIYLIGDATPPIILGAEGLEEDSVINRENGAIQLQLVAHDELSGLESFYVEIYNEDNGGSLTVAAGEDGSMVLDLTGDSTLFAGDFSMNIVARDRVGNVRQKIVHVTEFALEAKAERILAPHEPVFKRGESGILAVETWGYVSRVEVEFPDTLTGYNQIYEYGRTQYKTGEAIQFMIPLYGMEDGEYEITVRAYKDTGQLGAVEKIYVSQTVLDELRTRLR